MAEYTYGMNTHLYENIFKIANKLLKDYDITSFPIGINIIEEIIYDYGYNIEYFDNCKRSCVLGNCVICGKKDNEDERRITLSHELGHILIHCTNQLENEKLQLDKQESQVEAFILYFLIPDFEIENNLNMSMYEMTSYFGVDEKLIKKRLKYYKKSIRHKYE